MASPEQQAKSRPPGAGKNGNVPPPEHRFKPGQSGNPAGRPMGTAVSDQIGKILSHPKAAERVARGIIEKAAEGDATAFKALMDRFEGPIVQAIAADIKTGGFLTTDQTVALASQINELQGEGDG